MKNEKLKKLSLITLIVIGIVAIGTGILSVNIGEVNGKTTGVLFGMGAALIGASASQLMTIKIYRNNPVLLKSKTIEVNDERNILLKDKCKGKIFDIESLVIPFAILGLLLMDINPLSIFIFLGFYLLRFVLMLIYFNRYNDIL